MPLQCLRASTRSLARAPWVCVDIRHLSASLKRAAVVDYVPFIRLVVEAAQTRRPRASEGLGMLLHQAVSAFARWFGRRPEIIRALQMLFEANLLAAHEEER